jgi:phosphoribosylformylglycinamidine synthase
MARPTALILRCPGTNCDAEAAFAFERAGADTTPLHVNALRDRPGLLRTAHILVLPGGFSYGDDVAAGRILANQLRHYLADAVRQFRMQDKLVLGICNGFQVLLKAGLLVPPDEDGPLATLAGNARGRFEGRWVELEADPGNCVFLKGVSRLRLPVAHGEGRFVARKEWILRGLVQAGQTVLRYAGDTYPANPNGSEGNVAGLCDATGRVFGLMPHPERATLAVQLPDRTRTGPAAEGDGMQVFRNAVAYFG